jgi:hypothetical protein
MKNYQKYTDESILTVAYIYIKQISYQDLIYKLPLVLYDIH